MQEWGSLRPDIRHSSSEDGCEDRDESDVSMVWESNGFSDKCELCNNNSNYCQNHHTSYEPEKTIVVCDVCHWKIHNKPGYYDHLDPTLYKNPKTGNYV